MRQPLKTEHIYTLSLNLKNILENTKINKHTGCQAVGLECPSYRKHVFQKNRMEQRIPPTPCGAYQNLQGGIFKLLPSNPRYTPPLPSPGKLCYNRALVHLQGVPKPSAQCLPLGTKQEPEKHLAKPPCGAVFGGGERELQQPLSPAAPHHTGLKT